MEMKNLFKAANYDAEFLVQTDGASMNGGASDENSTLDCILFAEELLEFSKTFGLKLIISGGTNINTPEIIYDSFADVEDYPIIAYGTYARKIVSNVQKDVALLRAQELYNITEGIKARQTAVIC